METIKHYFTLGPGYTPLYLNGDRKSRKLLDINPNVVLERVGAVEYPEPDFMRVLYSASSGLTYIGYVPRDKVNRYFRTTPSGQVAMGELQTKNPRDAEQYVVVKNVDQHNMCGELSACFIFGLALPDFLERWQVKDPGFWNRIFQSGKARTTGIDDLVKMGEIFGVSSKPISTKNYSPDYLDGLTPSAIVGVRINPTTGRLNGGGIGHWVVPVTTIRDRCGYGIVYLYNPFPNCVEMYSYKEFLASARVPYGVEFYTNT